MAAKHQGFGLLNLFIIASLLLVLTLAPHEDTEVDTQQQAQAATESYSTEDISENGEALMSAVQEQLSRPVHTYAGRTVGNEKNTELCEENLDQSELDDQVKSPSASYEECESGPLEWFEEEKAKYLKEQNTPEQHQDESSEQIPLQEKHSQFSGNIIQRSMQGLEDMLGHVEKSGVKVFEKLGGVMDQVGLSREHMLKRLDTVMDRVSESVSESKVRVIQSLDSLMDHVSASKTKMMEEIDQVIDKMAHFKVIQEIRALPQEIRESFVLSVRNRSYIAAGVMVAITTAILVAGAVYFAWCHQDAWSYHRVSLDAQAGHKEHTSVEGSVIYPAAVKTSASTQGLNVSNGHTTAVHGDGDHDGTNLPGDGSCQMVSAALGARDSDAKGKVSSVDVQKLPVGGSDTSLQLPLVSNCSETDIKPAVEATHDEVTHDEVVYDVGDLHEVQLVEIQEEDIPRKCQPEDMPDRDEHQNSMPKRNEHQVDSAFESLLSQDKSHTLASVDILSAFESKKDANIGSVESADRLIGSAFSGHISDNTVPVDQSYNAPLGISNIDGKRNIGPVAKVTWDTLGEEETKKECPQSSVGAIKTGTCGI